jgi:hypothetical protein
MDAGECMTPSSRNKKLYGIFLPACLIGAVLLTVVSAGCFTAKPPAVQLAPAVETTPATVYLWSGNAPVVGTWTFVSGDGAVVNQTFSEDHQFSEMTNESLSASGNWTQTGADEYTVSLDSGEQRAYTYDADSGNLTDTALPDTPLTLIETVEPTEVPASDLPDPIIGSWAFVNTDHQAVILSFSGDGAFAETLDGSSLVSGTWQQDSAGNYSVSLASGETRTYRYDEVIDTLYDNANPAKFITRQ